MAHGNRGTNDNEKRRGQTLITDPHLSKSRPAHSPGTSPTVSEIEETSLGSGEMGSGRSRRWFRLREERAGETEKDFSRGSDGNGLGNGAGVATARQGNAESIEMGSVTGQTGSPGGPVPRTPLGSGLVKEEEGVQDGGAPAGDNNETTVEYKVYKRRWFGLVQLTLLNIIVSWDVSGAVLFSPFFSYLLHWKVGCLWAGRTSGRRS